MSCELRGVKKISWSRFSLLHVAQALIYETTFYLKSGGKSNFYERINTLWDNTLFLVICVGFALRRLLF